MVGGGPAGAATAIYTARKGFRTGVAAERFGGQLHDTLGIENLPGTPYTEGPKLAGELKRHVGDYDIDLMDLAQAVKLVPASEKGGLHTVELGNGASLKARSLILATGARWRNMGVPGEAEYRNKGVAYCPHCDGPLFKGKRIAVIGGGNSGVEAAIDLAKTVGHVTLIEFDTKLRADEVLQAKLRSLPNVEIVTNGQTTEITGANGKVNGLRVKDRASGDERTIELEGVFVQIGLVPNTEWLEESGLTLTKHGEIATDEEGRTNLSACSPPAMSPMCRTSRSWWQWAKVESWSVRLRLPHPQRACTGSGTGRLTGVLVTCKRVILTGWRRCACCTARIIGKSNPRDAINRLDELPGKAHPLLRDIFRVIISGETDNGCQDR